MDEAHYMFACQVLLAFVCVGACIGKKIASPTRPLPPFTINKRSPRRSRSPSPAQSTNRKKKASKGTAVDSRPTEAWERSEQGLSQARAESTVRAVDAWRFVPTKWECFDVVAAGARAFAKQPGLNVGVKVAASLMVGMLEVIEKKRLKQVSPDVAATCESTVNMLQRADDVLEKCKENGNTHDRDLTEDVEEAVADLAELLKTYQKKKQIFRVAGTALFKQRLKEAEAVVDAATKLKSPLAARAAAEITAFIANMESESRRARRQRSLAQVEIPEDDVMITSEILGTGSFGKVFLGDYLGRNVACKVFSVEHDLRGDLGCHEDDETVLAGHVHRAETAESKTRQRKSFLRELQTMLRLRSPHTVNIYGAMTSNKHRLVLVMELLVGGSLRAFLHSSRPLSDEHRQSIVKDICEGMLFLHGKGTIHGDLKSANVMLDGDGRAKIGDFGTSRLAQHVTETGLVSHTTTRGGVTFAWAAPEVLNGAKCSYQSDVYSFGIVLWEVLVRGTPWQGLDPTKVFVKVKLNGERPFIPSGNNPHIARLMVTCWAQSPEERPTFRSVKNFVGRYMGGSCGW